MKLRNIVITVLVIMLLSCTQSDSNNNSNADIKPNGISQYQAYKEVIEEEITFVKNCNIRDFYDLLYFSEILDEYEYYEAEYAKQNNNDKNKYVNEHNELVQSVKNIFCDDVNSSIYNSKYCKALFKNWDSYFICNADNAMNSNEISELNQLYTNLNEMFDKRYSEFYGKEESVASDKYKHIFIRDYFAILDVIGNVSNSISSDEYVDFFKTVKYGLSEVHLIIDYFSDTDTVVSYDLARYISKDLIVNANSVFDNCGSNESRLIVREHAQLLEKLAERLGEYDEVLLSFGRIENKYENCYNCVTEETQIITTENINGHQIQYSIEKVDTGESDIMWTDGETKQLLLVITDMKTGAIEKILIADGLDDYSYLYSNEILVIDRGIRVSDGISNNIVLFDMETKNMFDFEPISKIFGKNIANPSFYLDVENKSIKCTFRGSPTRSVDCWHCYDEHLWYTKAVSLDKLKVMLDEIL